MGIGNIALVLLKPFGYLPALGFTMDQLFCIQPITIYCSGKNFIILLYNCVLENLNSSSPDGLYGNIS